MEENKEALDILFGENTDAKNTLQDLQNQIYNEETGFDKQISTHSMNDKTIVEKVKEKVEEFKEHNNLVTDPNDELISNKNSDRALPDELSKEDGVPITKVTEGIHVADNTDNTELISTHNSNRALDEKPITNTEEISVISTHNSSKFVDESLD